MKKPKLSYKVIRYVIPLVIAPLIVLGGFALINSNIASKQQSELVVAHGVAQNSQKLTNYLSVFGQTIGLLSRSPVLEHLMLTEQGSSDFQIKSGDLLAVFASYTEAYPDISSIELLAIDGQNLAFFSSDLFAESESARLTSHLPNVNDEQKLVVTKDESGTRIHFVRRVNLNDFEKGVIKHWGFLVINLRFDLIPESINALMFEGSVNLLYSEQGHVVFSSDPSLTGVQLPENEIAKLNKVASDGKPIASQLSFLPEQSYVHFNAELKDGLRYLSAVPYKQLYDGAQKITFLALVLLMISIFVIPTLIFLVLKRILVEPIEELGRASKKVGRGDFNLKFNFSSQDELGDLFKDFQSMTVQLKDYQTRLEDYKQHLEEKVQLRTEDLHTANEQLRQAIIEADNANQMKSRFLANMSHEIRTPLTAIIGFTEHLLNDDPDPEQRQKNLSTVLRNGTHLLELINNILDLSKIEAEKIKIDQQPVDLITIIDDINAVIAPSAVNKELVFDIDYRFPLPCKIESDDTRLKQILLNVCTNSVKFTKEGQIKLTVRCDTATHQVIFTVTDTGIGMTAAELEKIFNPFEQADTSTTRNYGGTGLGLCISKHLANLLGGDIRVKSEKGKGSEFEIAIATNMDNMDIDWIESLPNAACKDVSAPNSEQLATLGTILVAEDNPDNQNLIRLLLEKRGFEVDIVENGAMAVEAALIEDYDLILMDMQMPVMGGVEATTMLRGAGYDNPIIALTANVMKDDIAQYEANGCNHTVAKPIDQQSLFEAMQIVLQENQAHLSSLTEFENVIQNSQEYASISATFLDNLPSSLQAITSAFSYRDWTQLAANAHSLKGSAGCFGYPQLTELAAQIEKQTKNEELGHAEKIATLQPLIEQLQSQVATTIEQSSTLMTE
ncbi:hybrid sensor histidine kinase/response regulator [Saccharobesus litoralis]|uniref:histidine kinase n=1 Tax=Saccharobesus litoralis TaxID=2172099 RepID=A0A2S0VRE4_9ALTE|nr:ATP-binding protein [Saccharobesus litoralis]AWB66773.1 hybrid sensor histidine kinase/response regulator [Saccharobesus litoralis]